MQKIGILIPYSGGLSIKKALLNNITPFLIDKNIEIISVFIGKGDSKQVEKAIDDLCYNQDVDVVIGYVNYRVMVELFDKISKYQRQIFVNLSLGEIIPYSSSQLTPPPNFHFVSYDMYKQIAVLGDWIANQLPAKNCLICTSLYESGYSFLEAFRIGYHQSKQKELTYSILKNPPTELNIQPLIDDVLLLQPEHIHITLSGKELHLFVKNLIEQIHYSPTLSLHFPNNDLLFTPSNGKSLNCFSIIPTLIFENFSFRSSYIHIFDCIFKHLFYEAFSQLRQDQIDLNNHFIVLNHTTTTVVEHIANNSVEEYEQSFRQSAIEMISYWQNPYLCV